jgi:polyisoprenyl-teichoic acid--peptidoglycan teichoic acid transferase
MTPESPPRVGLGLIKRAVIAGVLITLMSAAAVASAAFLQADEVIQIVNREGRAPIAIPEIDRADAGSAQTIMVLGSDERFDDRKIGAKPRSDTIILVRLDPDNDAVSVMSLPRDLKVTIPGNGVQTKINAAYEQGGARLTLRTVKKVLSTPERPFRINHVVSIGFESFQRAINYVGCVYADIDQRYYNDNAAGQNFAAIDIKPGYQRICGGDALDYVRYRHTDNDLVRAARQQDFLRQIKNQKGVQELKDPTKIKTLAKVFSRYFDSDSGLRKTKQLFSLAKLAIFASDKPVREIPFVPDGEEENGAYLIAGPETIRKTVDRFMRGEVAAAAKKKSSSSRRKSASRKRKRARTSTKDVPGLESARRENEDQALLAGPKVDFPVYFPTLKRSGGQLRGGLSSEPTTRTYSIRDERGRLHRAYRMTTRLGLGGFNEYYGMQGTSWKEPPILDDPDETRTVGGRKLRLYYDGAKLRLVAWQTDNGAYWVTNTLLRRLSNRQMVAIAGSLQRLR